MAQRFVPLTLLGLFGLFLLVGRSVWQRYRYGSWGWSVRKSEGPERPVHLGGLLLLIVLVGESLLDAAGALPPPLWLFQPGPVAEGAGAGIVLLALVLGAVAQLQMGASWRIGIEADASPGLVRRGLFRISRNPIYLSMFAALAGFTLLLPTWPSLGLLAIAVATARSQVRQEEGYLLRRYGAEFRAYEREVGRFLPLIGRSR